MIVRLGIKTLHRCQVVALDWSRFNPSTRLLIAVKLMDLIVIPLGSIAANTAILLKEGPATLANKVPFFSLICDHCDIFTASPRRVAAASGSSLDAEVAARSGLAAGSEVAGAAAAGSLASGSMTSGPMVGGPGGGPAAHPGERAACAKSHDLAADLTKDAIVGLEAPQAPAFVNIVLAAKGSGEGEIGLVLQGLIIFAVVGSNILAMDA